MVWALPLILVVSSFLSLDASAKTRTPVFRIKDFKAVQKPIPKPKPDRPADAPPPQPEFYTKVSQGYVPELNGLSVCGAEGICISEEAEALIIFVGGTGAKPSAYGVAASMPDPVASMINMGFDAWAIENPMLDQYDRESGRAHPPSLEKFGSLSGQMEWLYRSLNFMLSKVPLKADGSLSKKIILVGRSTGTGLIAQGVRNMLLGVKGAEIFHKFPDILLTGVVGHSPEEINHWSGQEVADPVCDPATQPLGPKIFSEMDWANQPGVTIKLHSTLPVKLPRVHGFVGTLDQFQLPVDQEAIYRRFFTNHPQIAGTLFFRAAKHNPAAAVRFLTNEGQEIFHQSMSQLKPILVDLVKGNAKSGDMDGHPATDIGLHSLGAKNLPPRQACAAAAHPAS